MYHRSNGTDPGRDGCRVPLPWSGVDPPFGFTTATPWLPQPAGWKDLTVEAQTGDQHSMLELYRLALGIRATEPGLGDRASLAPHPRCVLAFPPTGFAASSTAHRPVTSAPQACSRQQPLDTTLLPPARQRGCGSFQNTPARHY